MKPGRLHRCFAPAQSWVANYVGRAAAPPRASPTPPSQPAASLPDMRGNDADDSSPTLKLGEAALLGNDYAAARRAFLKCVGAEPFSYARIVGRAMPSVNECNLRGLSNDDFVATDAAGDGEAQRMPGRDAVPSPATERSAAVKKPVKELSVTSAAAPSASPIHPNPPRWPSLLQLCREVERYTMTRSYLWETSDARTQASVVPRGLLTTSDDYAATPSLLALYPFSVLSRVAEHAVRHAWRGGPHLYPGGIPPERSAVFNFIGCPQLRLEDVASQQWDRAEAAHILLSVVQHPCIQKDLRQRLWTAAQRYHRDLLNDLDALTQGTAAEGRGNDVVEMQGFRTTDAPATVPLADVKRQLFSFPASVHFAVVPSTDASSGKAGESRRVVLQPLSSSHWFHFTSANSDVLRILSERPHTDIFVPPKPFIEVSRAVSGRTRRQKMRTTQDQMWLLLSEMSRLRVLIAYLLHLEEFLYNMRKAASLSPARRKALGGTGDVHPGSARVDAQAAHDAHYVGEVFHFLEVQAHAQLQRRVHNRRFLSKYRMRLAVDDEADEGGIANHTLRGDDVSRSGASRTCLYGQGGVKCFSTVQGLFTAFIQALERGDSWGSVQRSGAADLEVGEREYRKVGSGKLKTGSQHTSQVNSNTFVDLGAESETQEIPLSPDDRNFLEAIVSARPSTPRSMTGDVRSSPSRGRRGRSGERDGCKKP
ncbi:hypothetical protein ABL78_6141 [Leptomonas seymouri]|uniref:Uncharacterized protein n=1 Tax=Leptomonas seymouri TaxID=5684 RepID=A0A0N1IJ59_LEPSE|nr:hypothetical protein ABL78_6141 [Leptomonas seymouri]|eukprot:KPI84813.1 hypothetical protein ABL78_6141 [Leptomonas seymouri]